MHLLRTRKSFLKVTNIYIHLHIYFHQPHVLTHLDLTCHFDEKNETFRNHFDFGCSSCTLKLTLAPLNSTQPAQTWISLCSQRRQTSNWRGRTGPRRTFPAQTRKFLYSDKDEAKHHHQSDFICCNCGMCSGGWTLSG